MPNKGEREYAVRKTSQVIGKTLGYHKFIYRGDQEPALQMDRSSVLCGEQVIREASPVRESQSNGAIESVVGQVQGQYRTIKSDLETCYKRKIDINHPVLTWLVMHAGATIFRHRVEEDGKTAHRRLKGKEFKKETVKFEECVWYLMPKTKGKSKAENRWAKGVWMGIR